MHHDAFLLHLRCKSLVSEKSDIYFFYNGVNKTSKFCFRKCIWIFFLWKFIFQNIIRILCRYCYKVLKNKKAMYDSHMLIKQQKCQHTTQTQQIAKCCKMTHNFQEISDKSKMLQNFINILLTIPTKQNGALGNQQ